MCVLLTLELAGCNFHPLVSGNDPIAARLENGVFSVMVCQPWSLTAVLVETRSSKLGSEWEEVWVADGQMDLKPGDALSSDFSPTGLSVSTWNVPSLEPHDDLSITLVGLHSETLDSIVRVPESGFPESGWLQADGTVTETAC
jgi:hypothetical protein